MLPQRLIGGSALLLSGAVAAALLALPVLLPPYSLLVVQYALVYAIACLGLNLLLGHTGLLSLGHAAFFGAGAYAGGLLYTFGVLESFEGYLVTGVVSAAALAAALGFVCVRTTRIQFTILTLVSAQIVHSLFISGIAFEPFGGFGKGLFLEGGGGLYIPRLTLGGVEVPPTEFGRAFYYVVLGAFLGSALLMWRLTRSPLGKSLHAIRDNDLRAEFIGLPVRRFRWYAFILSGTFAGLAGALFGQLGRQVTPQQLHWLFSAQLVLATVLGGARHFWGPVLGALALTLLEELALRFTLYRGVVLGSLLVAVTLGFPDGIAGAGARLLAWVRRGGGAA